MWSFRSEQLQTYKLTEGQRFHLTFKMVNKTRMRRETRLCFWLGSHGQQVVVPLLLLLLVHGLCGHAPVGRRLLSRPWPAHKVTAVLPWPERGLGKQAVNPQDHGGGWIIIIQIYVHFCLMQFWSSATVSLKYIYIYICIVLGSVRLRPTGQS